MKTFPVAIGAFVVINFWNQRLDTQVTITFHFHEINNFREYNFQTYMKGLIFELNYESIGKPNFHVLYKARSDELIAEHLFQSSTEYFSLRNLKLDTMLSGVENYDSNGDIRD